MLNEKVASLLNEQINKEFYSAYLYLEFSAYFEDEGLDGFANWYKVQAQEERDHAMLMFQYLQNNSHRPVLEGIARPTAAPNGRLEVLKAGLAHEQYVTNLIHTIYDAAYGVKDFRTVPGLVCQRAGRGGEDRRGYDQKDGALRRRCQRPLHA